jgi:hypothetical protein
MPVFIFNMASNTRGFIRGTTGLKMIISLPPSLINTNPAWYFTTGGFECTIQLKLSADGIHKLRFGEFRLMILFFIESSNGG